MANPYPMRTAHHIDRIAEEQLEDERTEPDESEDEIWRDNVEDQYFLETSEWDEDTAVLDEDAVEDGITQLNRITIESSQQHLLVPNYPEDEAVRHATLPSNWRLDGEPPFSRHGTLEVQMREKGGVMTLDQAQEAIVRLGTRTLLTLRIAMGLWNLRRADQRLCRNGSVVIRADELLYWLGIEKHGKTTGGSRRTDGWRPEEYETLKNDFLLAASLWVCGTHTITSQGKHIRVEVDASYIHVSFVSTSNGRKRLFGLFFSPGDWFNVYPDNGICYLTPLNRRIFELHPQNDQHALRIALYLAERWRKSAAKRCYDTPVIMETLLHESAITIPDSNRKRFAARIAAALRTLQQNGIIGQYIRTSTACATSSERFSTWLASEWQITPPEAIVEALNNAVRPLPPPRRR